MAVLMWAMTLFILLPAGLLRHTTASERRDKAVDGSYERRIAALQAVEAAAAVAASCAVFSITSWQLGWTVIPVPATIYSILWVVIVVRDDMAKSDDWPPSQWKRRLGRRLRELRKRLAPSPLPVTAA